MRRASVPFHSSDLLGARVTEDQHHGLVMIVRNFASLDSTYILPWGSAPLSFPMDRYGSALHSAVEEISATKPEGITAAVRRVNLSGAAGQEAADREQRHLELEQFRISRTVAAPATQFLKSEKIGVLPLAGIPVASGTLSATKNHVAGSRLGLTPTELMKQNRGSCNVTMPIGLLIALALALVLLARYANCRPS